MFTPLLDIPQLKYYDVKLTKFMCYNIGQCILCYMIRKQERKKHKDICLIYMHVYVLSCSVVSDSLGPQGL